MTNAPQNKLDTYTIDVLSLCGINNHKEKDKIWKKVLSLVDAGRLKIIREVIYDAENICEDAFEIIKSYQSARISVTAKVQAYANMLVNQFEKIEDMPQSHSGSEYYAVAEAYVSGRIMICEKSNPGKTKKICSAATVDTITLSQLLKKK